MLKPTIHTIRRLNAQKTSEDQLVFDTNPRVKCTGQPLILDIQRTLTNKHMRKCHNAIIQDFNS